MYSLLFIIIIYYFLQNNKKGGSILSKISYEHYLSPSNLEVISYQEINGKNYAKTLDKWLEKLEKVSIYLSYYSLLSHFPSIEAAYSSTHLSLYPSIPHSSIHLSLYPSTESKFFHSKVWKEIL